jgi:cobalt/nickel transport system permease protein
MAHIHLEDGSFTLSWVLFWWACAFIIIGTALYLLRTKNKPDTKTITIAAFLTAASFAIFQVSLPAFGGVHMNLTPLIGILAGPVTGSLIVFIVNILSAAIGHGGWGLIGANVLVNVSEVLVAYFTWKGMKKVTSSLFARAGTATILGLLAGNVVMIVIILISGVQGTTLTAYQTLTGLFILAAVNMGVAVIEAIITGLVAAYIGKARPDLLKGERS